MSNQRDRAREFTNKIPLVRVVSTKTLIDHDGVLPLSSVEGTSSTRATETAAGLPPSIYFFAGRAHPDHGDHVFAFRPQVENDHNGSANPFDTGGVFHGHCRSIEANQERKIQLIRETIVPLPDWRRGFADFVEIFFDEPRDYFTEPPHPDADWGPPDLPARHPQYDDWRCWTWEVRFHETHEINEGVLAWACQERTYQALSDRATTRNLPPGMSDPLDRLLRFHNPIFTDDPYGEIVERARDETSA